MPVAGSIVLVTGANRGIGRAFVDELLKRGVAKLYAAMRSPEKSDLPDDQRIVPIQLDLADPASIEAAAAQVPDLELLVNNAGYAGMSGVFSAESMDAARQEMEVNYFGPLQLVRALRNTPVCSAKGGIINVGSYAAYVTLPITGTYCASKAANLALSRTMGAELKRRGARVIAVLPTLVNTEMGEWHSGPSIEPSVVAIDALDALDTDLEEVYPGDRGKMIDAAYRADPVAIQARMSAERVTPF